MKPPSSGRADPPLLGKTASRGGMLLDQEKRVREVVMVMVVVGKDA